MLRVMMVLSNVFPERRTVEGRMDGSALEVKDRLIKTQNDFLPMVPVGVC